MQCLHDSNPRETTSVSRSEVESPRNRQSTFHCMSGTNQNSLHGQHQNIDGWYTLIS